MESFSKTRLRVSIILTFQVDCLVIDMPQLSDGNLEITLGRLFAWDFSSMTTRMKNVGEIV